MQHFDVVIVGAGTAGCVLAGRLSEDPARSVLLIEAGPDFPDAASLPPALRRHDRLVDDPAFLWSYDVMLSHMSKAPARQVRGKLVGGSSAVNGALFLRGTPEDFDAWGSDLWSFRSVLPYFRKAETDRDFQDEFHGTDGPIPVWRHPRVRWTPFQEAFYQAAVSLGFPEKSDLNHPVGSGVGPLPQNNPDGVKVTTAVGYLNPHRDRPNLTIQPASMVTRIVLDGRRAVGVAGRAAGQNFEVRADEVILSAGSFGSPQLLLLAGIGPAEDLRRAGITVVEDLAGVGQNVRCHPSVPVLFRPAPGYEPTAVEPQFQTVLHYSARGSTDPNDMMLLPVSALQHVLGVFCSVRLPHSVGELRIRSADAAIQPSIVYGYLDPHDLERMRASVRLSVELAEQPALKRAVSSRVQPLADVTESDTALDRWILETLTTSYHACGTCKLGPSTDARAVVDEHCRVRGVDGLRVVDLSIVPQSVRSGPHSTVVMLAERAADLIKTAAAGPPQTLRAGRR